jgi:hypothetical protein
VVCSFAAQRYDRSLVHPLGTVVTVCFRELEIA